MVSDVRQNQKLRCNIARSGVAENKERAGATQAEKAKDSAPSSEEKVL